MTRPESKRPTRRSTIPDKETSKTHKSGKKTGYDITDGKHLVIAPMYADRFDELLGLMQAEFEVTDALLRQIQAAAVERQQRARSALRELWQRVADDLDLDLAAGWEYLPSIRSLRRKEKPLTLDLEEPKP